MKTKAKAEEQDFQAVTDSYARRVIASMRDDLEALKHAQECNGMTEDEKPCQRGRETEDVRQPGGPTVPGMSNRERFIHENPEAWHDEERARAVIEEAPLSVEVRDGWRSVADRPRDDGTEAEEYCILLGTGGPASRIVGDLDSCQPTTARFEYQDWGKPWTQARLTDEDTATLLEWAQQFYFGG